MRKLERGRVLRGGRQRREGVPEPGERGVAAGRRPEQADGEQLARLRGQVLALPGPIGDRVGGRLPAGREGRDEVAGRRALLARELGVIREVARVAGGQAAVVAPPSGLTLGVDRSARPCGERAGGGRLASRGGSGRRRSGGCRSRRSGRRGGSWSGRGGRRRAGVAGFEAGRGAAGAGGAAGGGAGAGGVAGCGAGEAGVGDAGVATRPERAQPGRPTRAWARPERAAPVPAAFVAPEWVPGAPPRGSAPPRAQRRRPLLPPGPLPMRSPPCRAARRTLRGAGRFRTPCRLGRRLGDRVRRSAGRRSAARPARTLPRPPRRALAEVSTGVPLRAAQSPAPPRAAAGRRCR